MSYPSTIEDTKTLLQTLKKKEYAQLYASREQLPIGKNTSYLTDVINKKGKLLLRSHQKFVRNWMNPLTTPNNRLLIKWGTGVGKTLGSIAIAMEFIHMYLEYYMTPSDLIQPNIFIIGFSKRIFQTELIKRPEFGFITEEDLSELRNLEWLAAKGSQVEKNAYSDAESAIKKRLNRKNMGGFFKFLGYKEFFNKLFKFSEKEEELMEITEEKIFAGLKSGRISLNIDLVKQFNNSFCIFDEIHNVYNSTKMNTYGLAIKILLNIFDFPANFAEYIDEQTIEMIKKSSVRAVFTTATPINNMPHEIVDLLNIVVPAKKLDSIFGTYSLKRDDIFASLREFKPGMLEKIRKAIRGLISFMEDRDPKHYPARIMVGEEIIIPKPLLKERPVNYRSNKIPYLKFIRCAMSPFHFKTYKHFYHGTMSIESSILDDIAVPNPETDEFGLYKYTDIKNLIKNAPQKWLDKNLINIKKQKIGNTDQWIIFGDFLHLNNLRIYSTKYETLVRNLIKNLQNDGGKIIISHQFIRGGILLIQEILRKNGFIDETSLPNQSTRCSKCGTEMKSHDSTDFDHNFIPARFIIIYGDIDKNIAAKSEDRFKSIDNIFGYQYRILLGSSVINEGRDYSEIQEIHIMDMPGNIPTLLQILGRTIRHDSAKRLPPEKRKVYTYLYTSKLPSSQSSTSKKLSHEEEKYFEKCMDYLVIQEIDKIFNEESIDLSLNKEVIKNLQVTKPTLELLPLELPKTNLGKLGLVDLDTLTFNIFYSDEEVSNIVYIIKRLFLEQQRVWNKKDLYKAIKNPPFDIQTRADLFSDQNIEIALWLLTNNNSIVDMEKSIQKDLMDKLFDPTDSIIKLAQTNAKIVEVGDYYMLVPLINGVPQVDFEAWHRKTIPPGYLKINITNEIKVTGVPYFRLKIDFYNKYADLPIEQISTSIDKFGIDFHKQLLQECIVYVFNILINANMPFAEFHQFYFKMLYFYDKLDLVLFADQLHPQLAERYSRYITTAPIQYGKNKILKEKNKYNALLMSSIIKSSQPIMFDISRINEYLGKTKSQDVINKSKPYEADVKINSAMFEKVLHVPKKIKIVKTFANMLPVGHFLDDIQEHKGIIAPYLYIPQDQQVQKDVEWIKAPEFSEFYKFKDNDGEVDNDIIIGYLDRGDDLEFKFKLIKPIIQTTTTKDLRKRQRGNICSTLEKRKLEKIAKQLGIKKSGKNIKNMCEIIKTELMRRELNARRKHRKGEKHIRWFYYHFE